MSQFGIVESVTSLHCSARDTEAREGLILISKMQELRHPGFHSNNMDYVIPDSGPESYWTWVLSTTHREIVI